MKSRVTVDTIGHGTVSPEEKAWRRYERETLISIAMFPTCWDGPSEIYSPQKRLSKEQFSTNYKTLKEFNDSRELICQYLLERKVAPVELVSKVVETVQELNIKFYDILE